MPQPRRKPLSRARRALAGALSPRARSRHYCQPAELCPYRRPDNQARYPFANLAGQGEDGALDAIREYTQTIDTIARRIEDAFDPKPEPADDAVAVEVLAA